MSKKHRKQSQAPSPGELLGGKPTPEAVFESTAIKLEEAPAVEEAPVEVTEPIAEAPKAEASTLEQMVANLPPELREKAQAELDKLVSQSKRNEAAKAFVAFDNALRNEEAGLPKFIGDLAKAHGVDLASRRITITYPDGKFAYTNSPKGSKANGSGGSRTGFPTGWGKATVVEGDKTTEHASPSKAAEALGLQVEGMRNMVDVFENPHERGTKAELPKRYKVDAVRGEHFRITIKS